MLFLSLTFKNIKNNKFFSIISIIVLFLVIIFSVGLNFFYKNIERNLVNQEIGKDKNKIIIKKNNKTFFNKILNGNNDLINILKELKNNENIERFYTIYKFKIPVSLNINFLGLNFTTDTLVFASDNIFFSGNKVNIGINSSLVNLYNSQVADGSFFPKFTLETFKKINLELVFGKSSFVNYKKNLTYKGIISKINESYPIFGITIPYNLAKIIKNKIGGKIEIYNIIAYTKNEKEVIKLKNKYKNLQITSYDDKLQKIREKIKIIKISLNSIKYLIYILMMAFIIFLAMNLVLINKKTLKVLYYHGASIFQQFLLIFYTISFYIIIAVLLNLGIIYSINQKIPQINQKIYENGYIGINIQTISYQNFIILVSLLFLSINFISFIVFIKNRK